MVVISGMGSPKTPKPPKPVPVAAAPTVGALDARIAQSEAEMALRKKRGTDSTIRAGAPRRETRGAEILSSTLG